MDLLSPAWPKLVQLTDKFGNTFYVGNAGDFFFPPFPIGKENDYRTHVRRIRDMEIRPDDVIISSFPKAGLHWHHEMVSMLMSKSSDYRPAQDFATGFLDLQSSAFIEALPSPRLLITHVPFRYFPKQALDPEKKVKVIRLDRNPKDCLASLYCHMSAHNPPLDFPGTFEHLNRLFFDIGYIYGDMFDYLMEWQEGIEANPEVDIYTSVYEDVKQDPVAGVAKLNSYLATQCNKQLCEDVAKVCSFDKLQPHKDATAPEEITAFFKKGKPNFYRKGQVGDWKNWFTVALNEEYEEEYNKRMAGYKRQYKYTLD